MYEVCHMMAILGYGLKSLLSVYLSFSLLPAVEGRSITHCRFIAKVPIIWPPSLHYEPYLSDETGNGAPVVISQERGKLVYRAPRKLQHY